MSIGDHLDETYVLRSKLKTTDSVVVGMSAVAAEGALQIHAGSDDALGPSRLPIPSSGNEMTCSLDVQRILEMVSRRNDGSSCDLDCGERTGQRAYKIRTSEWFVVKTETKQWNQPDV